MQWEFKVIILAVLDVWFWTTLLPSSPVTQFLQLWAKVDREPRRKLQVAHHSSTTSSVRQLPWIQSVCKRIMQAGRGGGYMPRQWIHRFCFTCLVLLHVCVSISHQASVSQESLIAMSFTSLRLEKYSSAKERRYSRDILYKRTVKKKQC